MEPPSLTAVCGGLYRCPSEEQDRSCVRVGVIVRFEVVPHAACGPHVDPGMLEAVVGGIVISVALVNVKMDDSTLGRMNSGETIRPDMEVGFERCESACHCFVVTPKVGLLVFNAGSPDLTGVLEELAIIVPVAKHEHRSGRG